MKERERTFLMVKPDGVQSGAGWKCCLPIRNKGFKLIAMKMMQISPELAAKHYGEHKGKPFYDGLIEFITSAPVVAMIWEGDDVVEMVRTHDRRYRPPKSRSGYNAR
jgi:nucleoside-diphosphate kinase